MKKVSLLIMLASLVGMGQQRITLTAPPPSPVNIVTANRVGNFGNTTYYYWIVANYPIGKSVASPFALVQQAPDTLSGSDYVSVFWVPVANATSYDVLRTTTANITVPCTCAVVTGVSSTTASYNDTSNSLSSYTLNPARAAQANITLDNQGHVNPRIVIDTTLDLPIIGAYTVAQLPLAGSGGTVNVYRVAVVTNGLTGTDCTSGGGTSFALCLDNTSAWVSIGGGGSGTSTGNNTYCADTSGSHTAFTCPSPTPTITTYNGLIVTLVPGSSCSGAASLNVSGLGVKTLKQSDGSTNFSTCTAGSAYLFSYDGTNLRQSVTNSSSSGSTTAYTTVTYSATPTYTVTASTSVNPFKLNLTGNVSSSTLDTTNATAGQAIPFRLCQDVIGNRTNVWPVNLVGAPTIDPTANVCTDITSYFDGTNAIVGTNGKSDDTPTKIGPGPTRTPPSAPAINNLVCWFDQTDTITKCMNSSSVVSIMPVVKAARTANQFVTNIPTTGIQTTAGIVTADLPIAQTTRTKCYALLDWTDATDTGKLQWEEASAIHLTRVYGSVVGATNAVISLDKRAEATPNTDSGNHLISDLTLITTGASTTTFANGSAQCGGTSSCAIAARLMIVLTITSVSSGATGDALRACVEYTVD